MEPRVRTTAKVVKPVSRQGHWRRWVAAAGIILVGGLSWLLWQDRPEGLVDQQGDEQTIHEGLAGHTPSSKVQLITAGGNTITVDSLRKFTEKDGTNILAEGGTMSYLESTATSSHEAGELMNTLIVPRGYIQSIVLSDGTKVWLNADSKILFPVRFGKQQRKVAIEGEAYFEVKHHSDWPFIVSVNTAGHREGERNAEIKVLGTSFNVKAFNQMIAATLVQGSVLFSPPAGRALEMTPDQQAVYNQRTGLNRLSTVNSEDWTAWKNDDLVMNNMKLSELAEILERRYDVEISFSEERLKNVQYNAALHLTNNVVDMLDNLEQTGNIRFAVKDKKIVILPYEK